MFLSLTKATSLMILASASVQVLAQGRCGPNVGSCPMSLCCSSHGYCGTTDLHCLNGCQQDFGTCGRPNIPNCPQEWNTSNKRKIGYYMAGANDRSCNRMQPKDIDLSQYTHAFFAFAKFDSNSFEIVDDQNQGVTPDLYTEFTSRKSNNLQTWISVGGGGFGAKPWQAMMLNTATRGAFINSLGNFMNKYGFQGADLDFEFPQNKDDGYGFKALVDEMRGAYQGNFGISITLSTDPASLEFFLPKEMSDRIDMINFMTYDYATPQRSNGIQAHTDWTKIEESMKYLWKDGVDPSKVNLGLAFYAYSYTLGNDGCTQLGCPAKGKGNGQGCTNDPEGVLPLFEIEKIRAEQNLSPWLNTTAKVAQMGYSGNQFISYDNEDALWLKIERANELCLGGLMVWAVSFATAGQQQPPLQSGSQVPKVPRKHIKRHLHHSRHRQHRGNF